MANVILFGAGQVASVAYHCLTHDSPHEVVAFTLDDAYLTETRFMGRPVVPFEEVERHFPPEHFKMQVSISFRQVNQLRAEKYRQAKDKGYTLINYISSSAEIWPEVTLGDNCVVGSYCILQPGVRLGNNVTVGSSTLIGHHTTIGDHCSLAVRATISGSVTLGPYCFVGASATIRDRVSVGRACVIGAGALILEDTNPGEVYLGTPAELLPLSSDQLPLG